MDYHNVATTFFTLLEYGCVGMSEEDARSTYGDENVDAYVSEFMPLEWSLTSERAEHGAFCKVMGSSDVRYDPHPLLWIWIWISFLPSYSRIYSGFPSFCLRL